MYYKEVYLHVTCVIGSIVQNLFDVGFQLLAPQSFVNMPCEGWNSSSHQLFKGNELPLLKLLESDIYNHANMAISM